MIGAHRILHANERMSSRVWCELVRKEHGPGHCKIWSAAAGLPLLTDREGQGSRQRKPGFRTPHRLKPVPVKNSGLKGLLRESTGPTVMLARARTASSDCATYSLNWVSLRKWRARVLISERLSLRRRSGPNSSTAKLPRTEP